MDLSYKHKLNLEVQRVASRVLFVLFGPLINCLFYFVFKYKSKNINEIRRNYKELLKEANGPVLICSNHLTLIDSIIQSVLFNSITGYLINFKSLPWNLPEKKNFYHNRHWRLICYLGKCIPVLRGGSSSDGKKSLNEMQYVLNKGDSLSIFPEGKRSRSGYVDDQDFSYASGQILNKVPHAKVLCVYMRGIKDGKYGHFPIKGEEFYLKMELIEVKSELTGKRRARDLSTQIVTKLKSMEGDFLQNETFNR